MSRSPLRVSVPTCAWPMLLILTIPWVPVLAHGAMAGPRDLGYQYLAPAPGARLV